MSSWFPSCHQKTVHDPLKHGDTSKWASCRRNTHWISSPTEIHWCLYRSGTYASDWRHRYIKVAPNISPSAQTPKTRPTQLNFVFFCQAETPVQRAPITTRSQKLVPQSPRLNSLCVTRLLMHSDTLDNRERNTFEPIVLRSPSTWIHVGHTTLLCLFTSPPNSQK